MLSVVSVQPFANEVANYTCCNRDKKCNNSVHAVTSFLLERVDSIAIITQQKKPFSPFLHSSSELKRVHPATAGRKNSGTGTEGDRFFQAAAASVVLAILKTVQFLKNFFGAFRFAGRGLS